MTNLCLGHNANERTCNLKMKENPAVHARPCLFWSRSEIFEISIWPYVSLLGANFVGARINILVQLICKTFTILTVKPNLAILTLYLHCANGARIFDRFVTYVMTSHKAR